MDAAWAAMVLHSGSHIDSITKQTVSRHLLPDHTRYHRPAVHTYTYLSVEEITNVTLLWKFIISILYLLEVRSLILQKLWGHFFHKNMPKNQSHWLIL